MTNEEKQADVIQYKTVGTCCQMMYVAIKNDEIIDVEFLGGCNGNLQAIKRLIIGENIDIIIEKLSGICCGDKDTSCADQLTKCLVQYKNEHFSHN